MLLTRLNSHKHLQLVTRPIINIASLWLFVLPVSVSCISVFTIVLLVREQTSHLRVRVTPFSSLSLTASHFLQTLCIFLLYPPENTSYVIYDYSIHYFVCSLILGFSQCQYSFPPVVYSIWVLLEMFSYCCLCQCWCNNTLLLFPYVYICSFILFSSHFHISLLLYQLGSLTYSLKNQLSGIKSPK